MESSDRNLYHLNSDLVASNSLITLCSRYYKNPLKYPYSIALGYNYSRIITLPNLNLKTKNIISLVRIFSQTIYLNSRTFSDHTIILKSNSTQVYTSNLFVNT